MPAVRIRHVAFSHFESDECGSANLFLAVAPGATPVCGTHTVRAAPLIERLASCSPTTLACMHGSAWTGNGTALLRELAAALGT